MVTTGDRDDASSDKDAAPLPTSVFTESSVETQTQNDTPWGAASFPGANFPIPVAASINMMDDLSAIFGGPSSAADFQDIEGEPEERRSPRFEPERKTQEPVAQALREKSDRDLQAQKELAEKHISTVEQMEKEVEKMERQMLGDKAEIQGLRVRIEGLKGERVFESELFQFCRELLNMRIARGRSPLSSVEKARLEEMQQLAGRGIEQYINAKGSVPSFICPSEDSPSVV